jgi:hypothetical protein
MLRRWLACVAALSIVFGLASFVSAKPPDLPLAERITYDVPDEDQGSAPADASLPVPLGSNQPEEGGFYFGSYKESIALTSYWNLPFSLGKAELMNWSMLWIQPIQMLGMGPNGALVPDGSEEACEDPEAMRCLPEVEDDEPVQEPEKIHCMPEKDDNQQGCVCPYLRNPKAGCEVRIVIDPVVTRSVLDNLEALETAAEGMVEAQRLAREGKMEQAIECLEKVRQLCPGSNCEKRAGELIDEFRAEEQQEPEKQEGGCCGPLGCMNQFGMCWFSYLLDWAMQAQQKGDSTPCPEARQTPSSEACGGSVCPKCEMLHAKHAGKEEMVNGLMKACYLAFGEGRYAKAVDLARQAYAIDPARVEADPLVYKMHLLGQTGACKGEKTKSAGAPAGDPVDGVTEEQETGADGTVSLVPHLPVVSPGVVEALDAVLTGADGQGKTKKPPQK